MKCNAILTGVQGSKDNTTSGASSFIITGSETEFLPLLAQLVVDPESAKNYLDWLGGIFKAENMCLLVTLDGKFGEFRSFENEQPSIQSELEEIVPFLYSVEWMTFGAEAPTVDGFIAFLLEELAQEPHKAAIYKYIPRPDNYSIPSRVIDKIFPVGFGLLDIEKELKLALREPQKATMDSLILLYLTFGHEATELEFDHLEVNDEINRRLNQEGDTNGRIFQTHGISRQELNLRQLRAQWHLQDVITRLDVRNYRPELFDLLARHLRSLEDDVLVELAMVGFYTEPNLMKPLLFAFSERLPEYEEGPWVHVIKGDITQLAVDAIVNAANEQLQHGGGVAAAISAAAGHELQVESNQLAPVRTGTAKATKGYNLTADWVIHAVGPRWSGGENHEGRLLDSAYRDAIRVSAELGVTSIAFPSISTATFGFPLELAAPIAIHAIKKEAENNPRIREIIICTFSDSDFDAYEKALADS